MTFQATLELGGKTATGIPVPDDVVAGLGAGRRPAVKVRLGDHAYRSTVASMRGRYMLPVSAANRELAGVSAGDRVKVRLELDTEPRELAVPEDLAAALDGDDAARRFFETLTYSQQRWYVLPIEGAKTQATRERRIAKALTMLREGRKR